MDGEQFDALVQRLTQVRLTRLDALRGLVASAAAGLTGVTLTADADAKQHKAAGKKAKGKHNGRRAKGEGQDKITLCHKPGTSDEATITVPESQAKGHLHHGDTLGPCTTTTTTTTTTTPPPSVCSGLSVSNPCFPRDASICGTNEIGTTSCRCGSDLDGNLTCYENAYCNDPRFETLCASNAECEAKFGLGSVCFSAEICCLPDDTGKARGCTSPCPKPFPPA